jgi:hypothetical protein
MPTFWRHTLPPSLRSTLIYSKKHRGTGLKNDRQTEKHGVREQTYSREQGTWVSIEHLKEEENRPA